MSQALNDSGFPLGDTDLFDNGLNDDGEEEEESLDAIRASVKQKIKGHKVEKDLYTCYSTIKSMIRSFHNKCLQWKKVG